MCSCSEDEDGGGRHAAGSCGCGDDCDCGCECCGGGFRRRFYTKAEQAEELEEYLAELKLEVQAVEEKLADLRR